MTTKELKIQLALGSLPYRQKLKLAISSRTSKKILTLLSKGKGWEIKRYVARNPNTPKEVLIILSKDENWIVKSWVAGNPNTPVEVLTKLAKDKDWFISHNAIDALERRK